MIEGRLKLVGKSKGTTSDLHCERCPLADARGVERPIIAKGEIWLFLETLTNEITRKKPLFSSPLAGNTIQMSEELTHKNIKLD